MCYHIVKKYQAAGILCVGWIPVDFNLEFFFEKTTIPGNKRHNLAESILLNIVLPVGGIDKE